MRRLAVMCVAWGIAAPALAAGDGARVVATSPADGATVPAGAMELSVTFDRAMAPDSYSFVTLTDAPYPPCPPPAEQSADGRTFTLKCTTEPGKTYGVGFNGGTHMNFKSTDGVPAVPAQLHFKTAP
ncbi:Ig-like domain-containing protein [Zavarzinia sp. CC-PAN008]|uniref:Ig-like domain-containing protein n=1 Tax=Zavarzinia sp. CC-PAN008 TaxID=3243332 RepID=UPI003F742E6C